jgi:hypothetical protein
MNWPTYNQSLVRRGDEILLGFDVINRGILSKRY